MEKQRDLCGNCGQVLDELGLCPRCDRCECGGVVDEVEGICLNCGASKRARAGRGGDFRLVVLEDVELVA
jgi:RNA polymerase subunit RPABC4/transcription elongation factor Spt4